MRETENKLIETEYQLEEAIRRAEMAEDKVADKDHEINKIQQDNHSLINDYKRMLQQLNQELNNQKDLNEQLQSKISNVES